MARPMMVRRAVQRRRVVSQVLWTPANLSPRPLIEASAANAAFSAGAVSSLSNSGTLGGNFAPYDGSVAQGAAFGAGNVPTLALNKSSSLQLASVSRAAGPVVVFAVAALDDVHGALFGWNWVGTAGIVWYTRDGDQSSSLYSNGAKFLTSGGDSVSGTTVGDSNPYLFACRSNATQADSYQRITGAAQSIGGDYNATPGAISGQPLFLGQGGTKYSGEYASGRFAYLAVFGDLSLSNVQKLEGYWAWAMDGGAAGTFVGQLPAAHPYKSRPPYTSDP